MAGAAERAKHWAEIEERGAEWGPASLAFIYRVLGRPACLLGVAPAVLYFYLSGAVQRRASLSYLQRVWRAQGRDGAPGHWHALRHFFAFGESLVDKVAAWLGHIKRADISGIDAETFAAMHRDPRGALIVSAHFGATEIVRAIANQTQRRRINVVIHTKHARAFNALIERIAPQSRVALLEATEFDVATAVKLSAAVERGEWVVIMGDRMPVRGEGRPVEVEFLGAPARFPLGPFVLAAALHCPTYLLFCYKHARRRRLHFSLLSESVRLARGGRAAGLRALVQSYARALEELVKVAPYQWFNFYDFWARPGAAKDEASGG